MRGARLFGRGANLITDVPGLLVGNASTWALKSGVTVLTSDSAVRRRGRCARRRARDAGDRSAGAGRTVQAVDALVLSGGSAFGLDAASGVMDGLTRAGGDSRLAERGCRSCRQRSCSTS